MDETTEKITADSTEELLEEYDRQEKCRLDDVISMQTAVCIFLAAGFAVLNYFYPETAENLLSEIKSHINDTSHTIQNPIDAVISIIESLRH